MSYNAANRITTLNPFNIGRIRMEDILSSCKALTFQEMHPGNIYSSGPFAFEVPKDHPLLIGTGSTALVFELPEVYKEWDWSENHPRDQVYLVGKANHFSTIDGKKIFYLRCWPAGGNANRLEETVASLNEMGFSVPEMKEFDKDINGRHTYYTIMTDLREGGAYKVASADDFDFGLLSNGNKLKKEYDSFCQDIAARCESGQFDLRLEGHLDEGAFETIKHVFLVQYAQEGEGRLVPADLNHLLIARKGFLKDKPALNLETPKTKSRKGRI